MKDPIIIELLEIVRSKTDKTIKFVFLSGGQVIEFSYINKDDGKDIICAPTQTACNLGCKFCFLSDIKLPVRNLMPYEIIVPVYFIIKELRLLEKKMADTALLISYMGCGEPLLNIDNVIEASRVIRNQMGSSYKVVRFAAASLIPALSLMEKFIEEMKRNGLKVKFHLSLHSADPMVRKGLMPSAGLIEESIELVEKFVRLTGNSAEIHYALIQNVNDRDMDAKALIALLARKSISVKFLAYNAKPSVNFEGSERVEYFQTMLGLAGIQTEFYRPPGWDVGSSCGQFLMNYYLKYKKTGE